MGTDRDKPLQHAIQKALNTRVDSLDAHSLSRLNRARQQALRNTRTITHRGPVLAFGASAAVAILALALWQSPSPLEPLPTIDEPVFSELELQSMGEDLELVEELDFYFWLDQARHDQDDA